MRLLRFITAILLLFLPAQVGAHGGDHAAPANQTQKPITLPPMEMDHSMSDMQADTAVEDFYGAGNSASSEEEVPLDFDSMTMEDHSGHNMADMPEVEIAKHELNSTSQKGYGLAAGFTLFAGLGFVFLSLKRPFE